MCNQLHQVCVFLTKPCTSCLTIRLAVDLRTVTTLVARVPPYAVCPHSPRTFFVFSNKAVDGEDEDEEDDNDGVRPATGVAATPAGRA